MSEYGLIKTSTHVTESMNDFLNSRFTAEEIDAVVQSMHHTKAPGEDGLPDLFYQQFWHIIGTNVGAYCLNILNNEGSLSKINHTNIILIPKRLNPVNMTHFRSISLCNVFLKIVTNVIVHRMQMIMLHYIE